MLVRNPSLAEQVKGHLKQRILNAEFEADRIPSETELARELGVSRNTVRDALSKLEAEGVVFRRQGAGTFVNKSIAMIKTRLEEILPYEILIRDHGYEPTVELLSALEEPAAPDVARELDLEADEPLLAVQKRFLADEQPVIHIETLIPRRLILRPYDQADLRAPVYDFLPRCCQEELAYFFSEIVPVASPDWLVHALDLPREKPCLLAFREIGYNAANRPLIRAVSYFRVDLLRLRFIRRPTPETRQAR